MAVCNKCGINKLEWLQDKGKWILYDPETGKFHRDTCQPSLAGMVKARQVKMQGVCKHGLLLDRWCDKCEEERG